MALIDTGAAISVMDAKLCRTLKKVKTPIAGLSLRTASAQHIKPLAACTARVVIQNSLYTIEFVVLPSCSHAVILGWDFLSRHAAIIDCARAEVGFSTVPMPYQTLINQIPVLKPSSPKISTFLPALQCLFVSLVHLLAMTPFSSHQPILSCAASAFHCPTQCSLFPLAFPCYGSLTHLTPLLLCAMANASEVSSQSHLF